MKFVISFHVYHMIYPGHILMQMPEHTVIIPFIYGLSQAGRGVKSIGTQQRKGCRKSRLNSALPTE